MATLRVQFVSAAALAIGSLAAFFFADELQSAEWKRRRYLGANTSKKRKRRARTRIALRMVGYLCLLLLVCEVVFILATAGYGVDP